MQDAVVTAPAAGQADLDLEIAADFPILSRRIDDKRLIYLDNAATSLKPACVIAAVTEYYELYCANIHRGKHRLSEEASDRFEEARSRVATFLRCESTEIVFVHNTTAALNMLVDGLDVRSDDLVICSADAHHSQLLPWRARANTKVIDTAPDGTPDYDHYASLLRESPKVVALTHCSNVSGVYAPLAEMALLAKNRNAIVVVDAAQSLPHRRIDVRSLPIDFLAFSGHKMLAPSGIGVLYGRREMLETLRPRSYGGGMVDYVSADSVRLRRLPHRLEAGTPSIEGAIGLARAIDYLDDLGEHRVAQHDRELGDLMVAQVLARPYLSLVGPSTGSDHEGLVSFSIPTVPRLADIARALSDSGGVMARTGHLCAQTYVRSQTPGEVCRFSAYVYNTAADVHDAFAQLDLVTPRYTT